MSAAAGRGQSALGFFAIAALITMAGFVSYSVGSANTTMLFDSGNLVVLVLPTRSYAIVMALVRLVVGAIVALLTLAIARPFRA